MRRLIVTERNYEALRRHVDYPDERMAFGYLGTSTTPSGMEYYLREVDLPADDEYRFQGVAGVSLKAERVVPRIEKARSSAAFLDAHSHPFTYTPSPSAVDARGALEQQRLMRFCAPDTALIRMVLGKGDVAYAEVHPPGSGDWSPIDELVVLGLGSRRVIQPVNAPLRTDRAAHPRDARTAAAIGATGAEQLRGQSVSIIGVGGAGSAVASLVAGYVEKLTVVDPDLIEHHNLPRLHLAGADDVGQPKVEALGRHVTKLFPWLSFSAVQATFPAEANHVLKDVDAIFCCPDHNAVRYAAARMAARYFKPLIEVGCGGVRRDGRIAALGYQVRLQAPGGPCLVCNGLDLSDLEDPSSTAEKRRIGYIAGGELVQGELKALTTRAAADAVDIFFRYVTGYTQPVPRYLYYDAIRLQSTDLSDRYSSRPDCPICGNQSVAGWGDAPEEQLIEAPLEETDAIDIA